MGFYENLQQKQEEPGDYTNGDLLNKAQPPAQSPQYDRVIQEEKVANFVSQTSPTKTLIKLDYILKGYVFDEGERKWIKVAQSIPDKIRLDFLQIMTPHLSEDVRMGRLDMKQINNIMEFIIEWTVDYLDIVADDYDLTEEQMTKIAILMWSAVFHTLSRAMNGVERDRMYNSLKLGDDLSQYSKPEQKKSLMETILPWK